MNLRNLLISFLVILLSGCSMFSPVQTNSGSAYLITELPKQIPQKNRRQITLLVLRPDARTILNTTQMAYTDKRFQVSYYGQNQWGETPSQMFLPLVLQTLDKTNHFQAVVTAPFAGRYDYLLNLQIAQFEMDFTTRPAAFNFTLRADISRASSGRSIAVKQFTVKTPLRQETPYAGVVAANIASQQLLKQLAQFILANT